MVHPADLPEIDAGTLARFHEEHDRLARRADLMGMSGFGVAMLLDERGRAVRFDPFLNLITTAGDQYYAKKGAAAIGTPNAAAPSPLNGMKLGTGATAVAKSGAGAAATGTFVTGSNLAFDSAFPTTSAVPGTDTGWYITYQVTWPAGTATNANINEVMAVMDQATAANSSAGNTGSRFVLPAPYNKLAGNAMVVNWSHKFLGS